MTLTETIRQAATEFVAEVKLAFADGRLSFAEAYGLAKLFVQHAVEVAKTLPDIDEESLKTEVLAAFNEFAWPVIKPLDMPGPDLIIDPILHSVLTTVISVGVDFAVDGELDGPVIFRGVAEAKTAGRLRLRDLRGKLNVLRRSA